MQIPAISAFNFKGSSTHTDHTTGILYDSGHPCGPAALAEDTFVRSEKPETKRDSQPPKCKCCDSEMKREPIPEDKGTITGYNNHEAYLY